MIRQVVQLNLTAYAPVRERLSAQEIEELAARIAHNVTHLGEGCVIDAEGNVSDADFMATNTG